MRLLVYSSVAPHVLRHLLWRISVDAPGTQVCGVLHDTMAAPTTGGIPAVIAGIAQRVLDRVLRFIHAAPSEPNGAPLTMDDVITEWSPRGVRFHITTDSHDADSRELLRELRPDMGLIYGSHNLESVLSLPRHGAITIHTDTPDLSEARDGRTPAIVTVQRVGGTGAGAVLAQRRFPIEPFDTLESIRLKADLIGVDLITGVLSAEAEGHAIECPQTSVAESVDGIPHRRRDSIHSPAGAPSWRPSLFRPRRKHIPRLLALPLMAFRNRRRRKSSLFPVVVLYHHLICDRPKRMGTPTAVFARQIRYLKRHYRIVSLPDAVKMLQEGQVTAPTVVLTFDDGYADNFLGLRAVAEMERVPITIFVCPAHLTARTELDHDVNRGERGFPSMGWEEVRYFDTHGVTIGSHTRTHFNCGVDDRRRLFDEIVRSREELEAVLGHPVDAFAFPKGKPHNISPAALAIARQTYPIVLSAAGGENVAPIRLPAEIRRHAHPDSIIELELQLQGLLDPAVPMRPIDRLEELSGERRPPTTHTPHESAPPSVA